MRQWDDARFERGQQHVLGQGVGDAGRSDGVGMRSRPVALVGCAGASDAEGTRSTVDSRGIQTS